MSRRDRIQDPFADENNDDSASQTERPSLSMTEADAALFGELNKRDVVRKVVRPVSIFKVYPDVQQPRRAVPSSVRSGWSGHPKDIADLFNAWLNAVAQERLERVLPPFNLDTYLWSEKVEKQQRNEDEVYSNEEIGPLERSFLKVVELAISIRRDGLANPVTIQQIGREQYKLETGERRWLAYHMLYAYFDGQGAKPNERDNWEMLPGIVVDNFSVWRQASENAARADLNAIGRARQFAILMIDLLTEQGRSFRPYEVMVKAGQSDRVYYAQIVEERVPSGKGEMVLNGLGMSHRATFSRCRRLLSLPDEVWVIGDNLDLSEDELLRLEKLPEKEAIQQVQQIQKNVASRNNSDEGASITKKTSPPPLFTDPACKRGNRLFPKQNHAISREIFDLKDGVGQANPQTKEKIRGKINELRLWLDKLDQLITED